MKDIFQKLLLAVSAFAFKQGSGLGEHDDLPVCVVGAGPAGLTAAAELELKGRRTVVFEKQDAVGGKCQAVYQEFVDFLAYHGNVWLVTSDTIRSGGFSPLGALIFTPPTYRETIKMMVDTDMASVPFVSGSKYLYNTTSGAMREKPPPPPGFTPLFMQEVGRYIGWWKKNFYLFNLQSSYRVIMLCFFFQDWIWTWLILL